MLNPRRVYYYSGTERRCVNQNRCVRLVLCKSSEQIQLVLSGWIGNCKYIEGKKKFGCRLGFGLERSMGDGDSLPVSWDGSPLGVKGCPRWTSWDGSERSARFQGLRRGRRPGGNGLPHANQNRRRASRAEGTKHRGRRPA